MHRLHQLLIRIINFIMQTILSHLGEDNCKSLINFTLRYIADLDIPVKRFETSFIMLLISIKFCFYFA